jgi:hypothetical protein
MPHAAAAKPLLIPKLLAAIHDEKGNSLNSNPPTPELSPKSCCFVKLPRDRHCVGIVGHPKNFGWMDKANSGYGDGGQRQGLPALSATPAFETERLELIVRSKGAGATYAHAPRSQSASHDAVTMCEFEHR